GGATDIVTMVVKTFLIYFINVFVGQAFPRFRVDQSIRFFLGVPTLIGIASVIIAAI
ncbi:MAG: NADH-quinone oxidoreductase subunit H, partial [Treponema sp.]|nr:NADH-quinone oxidoreductase subunit H [Treponema sp.]